MDYALAATQVLNGLQLGVLLFLLSAGLTLVFGIMNFVNLTHGSLYMMGAYFAAAAFKMSDSFLLAVVVAVIGTLVLGLLLDRIVLAGLYKRDHLDQVLATFGLILVFNEIVRIIWGSGPVYINAPEFLGGTVSLFGFPYPSYRFAVIAAGLVVGVLLYLLISKTRVGMLIRAGAADAEMVSALGSNITLLNTLVFGVGAALAGLAGYLWGAQTGYINPELMGFHMSAHGIMMVILGGMGNFAGAMVGAFAFEYLLHVFKDLPNIGAFATGKHWQLWMGLFIVLLVVFAPRGLLGLLEKFTAKKTGAKHA